MGDSVWVPVIQAFAAGAILTMLVDTMIPEAFADGGDLVGLATVLGFADGLLPEPCELSESVVGDLGRIIGS